MKWVLFTGTWRLTNAEVERDVRSAVRDVIGRGDGVLTGGAPGVDYFAMDETLKLNPNGSHLRVIIPAQLKNYIDVHYAGCCTPPITKDDIANLASLLSKLKEVNPTSLLEMPYDIITQAHYHLRNDQEVMYSNEVYVFQVNGSAGAQYTVDKSVEANLPITLHKKYKIEEPTEEALK